MLSTIGQIGMTVTAVARAVTFYRVAPGIPFLFEFPNMAFFDYGGMCLMRSSAEKPAESYNSILYFKMADIKAAYETLKPRDDPFDRESRLVARMADHDLWMAFFRDPGRNVLALMCEIPSA